MDEKKVPVSLSKNDYAFLNYIQQGLLYSGIPISNVLDFSDILKACVLHSYLEILGNWENHGKKMVEEFLKDIGISDFNLPKTNEELILSLELAINKDIIRNYLSRDDTDNSGMDDLRKKYGTEPMGSSTMKEPGVSNFILKLKGDEITLFDGLKTVLEKFKGKGSPLSYSEMTRILFRIIFINVDPDATLKQLDRFALLSSFYVNGVYGFNAVDSTLLLHRTIGEKTMPKISKEGLDRLSHVYSDEILFKIYIEEIDKNLIDEEAALNNSRRSSKNKGKETGFHNISRNKLMDEKYRSSVVNSVGFHSVFVGYFLLLTEWFWQEHKIPLLTSYLISRNELEYSFIHSLFEQALNKFKESFEGLFTMSKEYREKYSKF